MCGLFGMVAYREVSQENTEKLIKALGKASESRGTHAGGISWIAEDKHIYFKKNVGAISKNTVLDGVIASPSIMGHTRHTTQGLATHIPNNHPFNSTMKEWTMAHNGILSNDYTLRKKHSLPKTDIATDSYVVVQMLDTLHKGVLSMDTIRSVVEELQGSYNLSFQDKRGIWLVKNNNPLAIVNCFELGAYIYASTKEILYEALDSFYDNNFMDYLVAHKGEQWGEVITLNSGDIYRISHNGSIEKGNFTPLATTYYPTTWSDEYWDESGYYRYPHNPYIRTPKPTTVEVRKEESKVVETVSENPFYVEQAKDFNGSLMVFNNGKEIETTTSFWTDTEKGYRLWSRFLGKNMNIQTPLLIMSPKTLFEPFEFKDMSHLVHGDSFSSFMSRLTMMSKHEQTSDMIAYDGWVTTLNTTCDNATTENEKERTRVLRRMSHYLAYLVFLNAFGESKDWGYDNDESRYFALLSVDELFGTLLSVITPKWEKVASSYNLKLTYEHIQGLSYYYLDLNNEYIESVKEEVKTGATSVTNDSDVF